MDKRTSSSPQGALPQDQAGVLADIVRYLRLCWRLLGDRRVSFLAKMMPVLAVLYIVSPIDLIPDWPYLGLNQLDDLAVILLGMKLLVTLSPGEVVEQLRREVGLSHTVAPSRPAGQTVDADYRVVRDDEAGDVRTGNEVSKTGDGGR